MNRYLFDSDKKLSLFSELTLRMGLSNMLGCSPDYFRFESYKNGKPFITNEPNIYLTYLIQKRLTMQYLNYLKHRC